MNVHDKSLPYDYVVRLTDKFEIRHSNFTGSWILFREGLPGHWMPRDLSPRLTKTLLREWSGIVGLPYEEVVGKLTESIRKGVPGQRDPKPEFFIL